eukprot:EC689443.1.p2 GENE.EC689443.1~~EC689443.1.p2  ORF type:complete len:167 (+),score=58.59 EC689443.1:44-544(+)
MLGSRDKVSKVKLLDQGQLLVAGSDGMLRYVEEQEGELRVMNERLLCSGSSPTGRGGGKLSNKRRGITTLCSDGLMVAYGDASGFVHVGSLREFRKQLAQTRRMEQMEEEEGQPGRGDEFFSPQVSVFSRLPASNSSSAVLSLQCFKGLLIGTVRNQVVVHDFGVL